MDYIIDPYIKTAKTGLKTALEDFDNRDEQILWYSGFASAMLEMANNCKLPEHEIDKLWSIFVELGNEPFGRGWEWRDECNL